MTTKTSSAWRQEYRVHPAADVFPMMTDGELDQLGADIKANGLKEPITVAGDRTLLDGRNRLEAFERVGIEKTGWQETVHQGDPVAFIISKNIRRRHLTKQQQADLIVAVVKASRQDGEVPKRHVEGKAGSTKDVTKAEAVAIAKKEGISARTVERSLAKADGRKPKSKPADAGEPEPRQKETYRAPLRRKPKLETHTGIEVFRDCYVAKAAELGVDIEVEIEAVTKALREHAGGAKRHPLPPHQTDKGFEENGAYK